MNSLQRLIRTESRTKTPHEMLLSNGFAKVANDPIVRSGAPTMSGAGHRLAPDLLRWPRSRTYKWLAPSCFRLG
jgi:hypothetical protein